MRLHFQIEYRTVWGESLVLRIGDRRYAMHYAADGLWQVEIAAEEGATLRYGYEVEVDGRRTRREWRPHTLRLPAGVHSLFVRDGWSERGDDAPFYTSAFTRGIFARKPSCGSDTPSATENDAASEGALCLRVSLPTIRPDEVLALAGSGTALGDWQRILPFDDREFPLWSRTLPADAPFEYKLLVADRQTLRPLRWEEGGNRRREALPEGTGAVEALVPRFAACDWRGAGTAVPVFSLRSEEDFGSGEFADLKLLADWAAATGQSILQLLPINDTTMSGTWEDSYPYNANSAFALHPQYIRLTEAGVEPDAAYRRLQAELNALPQIDYERVNRAKNELLRRAFARHGARTAAESDYRAFVEANRAWLIPYALFRTLRDEFGTADFAQWGAMAHYDAARAEEYGRRHADEIAFHCYVQYHLHRQLSEACRYARSRGIVLKGDLPIGISRTSCDAWLSPHLFHMDSQAGAPPDAFSATGQNWGFPTYDWERMAADDYAWWRARLAKMADYFDAYRIDHLLGFFRIWEIPLHAVHGLAGCFNPALPYSAEELLEAGFDLTEERYTTPVADDRRLADLFGADAGYVRATCFAADGRPLPDCDTQRKAAACFAGDDERSTRIRSGLFTLLDDVLFLEDPRRKGFFHPRIGGRDTACYAALDPQRRAAFDRLHDDFFYRRHNEFWKASALRKLPALLDATGMLACGEDLGMIPACVPETMHCLKLLSLEIQRMPKLFGETFADPQRYPRLSVATTSTHDMTPLRAWWEEDRALTQRYYEEVLGETGEAPRSCPPDLCRRLGEAHLASPALFTSLPVQDGLAVDGELRYARPEEERINVPAIPRYLWRYRLHLPLERLLQASAFNERLREAVIRQGRG